jgi:hypothetical protein
MLAFDREANARRYRPPNAKGSGAMKNKVVVAASTKTPAKRKTPARGTNVSDGIDRAINRIMTAINDESYKPSVADLIRLLQLQKEFSGDQPKKVTVRWVDECQ